MTTAGAAPLVSDVISTLAGAKLTYFNSFLTDIDYKMDNGGVHAYGGSLAGYNLAFILATWGSSGVPGASYAHTRAQYVTAFKTAIATIVSGEEFTDFWNALAYDWGYNDMTAGERTTLVTTMKLTNPSSGSPWHHRNVSGDLGYFSTGLAHDGDHIDDADATAALAEYTGYLATVRAGTNYLAGDDGGVGVGFSYAVSGEADTLEWFDCLAYEAYRTKIGTARDTFWAAGFHTTLEYYPQWCAYMVRPWPGTDGPWLQRSWLADHRLPYLFQDASDLLAWCRRLYATTNEPMAGLAQWLLDNYYGTWAGASLGNYVALRHAILGNLLPHNTVTSHSPVAAGLPQSKWFDPFGWVVMRSGWSSTSDCVVTITALPYDRSNGSYSATGRSGHFTLDRRGPIAPTAGAGLHQGFSDTSWGMNVLHFVDPAETGSGRTSWDKGGQHPEGMLGTTIAAHTQLTPGSAYDIGGLKTASAVTPDQTTNSSRVDLYSAGGTHNYNYVMTDITRAYNGSGHNDNGGNTNKVSSYIRQFVYVPSVDSSDAAFPDLVFIHDRATTEDSKFAKWWLYHPPGRGDKVKAFSITGHSGTTTVTLNGHNNTSYTQPTLVEIASTDRGSLGRAYMVPHLPASRTIVELGGPDGSGNFADAPELSTTSHEYDDLYGFPDASGFNTTGGGGLTYNAQHSCQYTLAIRPASLAVTDNFLVTYELANSAGSSQSTTETLDGTSYEGARIGSVIAIFGKTTLVGTSGSMTFPTAGTYTVVWTGLATSAARTFTKGGGGSTNIGTITNLVTSATIASGGTMSTNAAGVLYFSIVITTSGSATNNTLSLA